MIGYIKGKVVHRGLNYVIVSTSGVGYKVYVTDEIKSKKSVELFIYHYLREDASDLFGFEKMPDLEIFEMLITVSGVGPKVAMALTSGLGREKIISAIARSEPTIFRTIPGVGAKVAAKIIVELKNKIASGDFGDGLFEKEDETIEALMSLGLKKNEIMPILLEMPDNLTSVQDKVKYVLKNVGKKK